MSVTLIPVRLSFLTRATVRHSRRAWATKSLLVNIYPTDIEIIP
jgi:hypothetical protein